MALYLYERSFEEQTKEGDYSFTIYPMIVRKFDYIESPTDFDANELMSHFISSSENDTITPILTIPEEITSLPEYGFTNGEKRNYIDMETEELIYYPSSSVNTYIPDWEAEPLRKKI
jgi:hypothetical protein